MKSGRAADDCGPLHVPRRTPVIDGKPHRWRDILELRRAQLAELAAASMRQPALFPMLHDDRRPAPLRTAAGRYQQPGLFEQGAMQ